MDSRPDPNLDGRTHETLLQVPTRGIPVFGASLSRQTALGVALSTFGPLFQDISSWCRSGAECGCRPCSRSPEHRAPGASVTRHSS